MKEHLEQLTMSQFVDMLCGNMSVLLDKHEIANPDKLPVIARSIIMEYRAVADPGGNSSYLRQAEDMAKAKLRVIIFTMCHNLTSFKQFGKAREVLVAYGMAASKWNDNKTEGVVKAKLEQARRELDNLNAENEKSKNQDVNIRAGFDTLTAILMAHFKFQIDPGTIRATLYANLVARYDREIKAQMAAMAKSKRRASFFR